MVTAMEQKFFSQRLATLRTQKGISARKMSELIGQSTGYINNIENGIGYPSMAAFFKICEFLGITPSEFFDADTKNPQQVDELILATKGLGSEQLQHLIALAKGLHK